MRFREEIGESLTLKFAQAASERRKKGLSIISLGLGEPDFNVPESIVESTINVLRTSSTGYSNPLGIQSLREGIASKLLEENAINCTPDNILVTAGAKQAFQMVCMALLEPGDEVIVINPSFVSFIPQIYIAEPSCVIKIIDVDKKNFALDMDGIKSAISPKTKILVLNTPNNPAGYVVLEKDLKELYDCAKQNNIYIISDEIYEKLIFTKKLHYSIGSFEEKPDKVITINGFSKSHAMTGWRLGYACYPDKLKQKLLKLQQHINTNTCTFMQQAVAQVMDLSEDYLEEYNMKLAVRSNRISEIISDIDTVSMIPPEAGFFSFLNISLLGIDSNSFCSRLIEETGVAITPGIAFGASWDDHVRISFATSEDVLERGMKYICDFIMKIENNR